MYTEWFHKHLDRFKFFQLYNKYIDVSKTQFLYDLSKEDQETFFQLVYLSEQA